MIYHVCHCEQTSHNHDTQIPMEYWSPSGNWACWAWSGYRMPLPGCDQHGYNERHWPLRRKTQRRLSPCEERPARICQIFLYRSIYIYVKVLYIPAFCFSRATMNHINTDINPCVQHDKLRKPSMDVVVLTPTTPLSFSTTGNWPK